MAAKQKKLRILCLHGYRQDGPTFNKRTGAFRKIIKKHSDLVFIDAPNIVPPKDIEENSDTENDARQLGWWFSRADDYFSAQDPSACVKGYQQSVQVIKEAFITQGPFDGVLGFSQGAAMVALLCGIQQQGLEPEIQFQFAVLVAGFKSRSKPHESLYQEKIEIPTLHVFGHTDGVISHGMSEDLLQHFKEPVILEHPGGHFVPASAPQKAVYQQFLQDMMHKCCAKEDAAS